jgi:hypothetical protein
VIVRNLVVCCDGTWQDAVDRSNVLRLNDPLDASVVRCYVKGVGTGGPVDKLRGAVAGAGLVEALLEGYRFLAAEYRPHDRISLFGFSRGAYTARSALPALLSIGGAAAASGRAAAALGRGRRGPVARPWRGARRGAGCRDERDHRASGVAELEWVAIRVRTARSAPGGGRKRVEVNDPAVLEALLALVKPDERGDPEPPLRWMTKSLRHLADELTRQGHPVSAPTVGRL